MMQELKLPALAESVVEGEVLHWLIEVGQSVTEGQSVLEIMTDKVTVELPSPFSGTLREQRVKVGDVVAVGGILGLIEVASVASATASLAAPEPQAQAGLQEERSIIESGAVIATDTRELAGIFSHPVTVSAPQPITQTQPARPVLAAPSARKLARQQGIDLSQVAGSGPGGVVRHADVQTHLQPETVVEDVAATTERRVPFKGPRRAISQGLMHSLAHTALTHTIEELDTTELTALRDLLRPEAQQQGIKLSYMPFFLKAVALALREYEVLNSSLDEAAQQIVYHGVAHLGIAVNTAQGLMVPVLRDVQHKSLLQLAREISDLTARALEGKLRPDELRGATFTVSNIGAVGALVGFPIVTPPSVGILSLHGIIRRPIALVQGAEEVVAVRPMMYLTLGFDHRLVDGVDAVRFTKRVVEVLEQPSKMLLHL